MLTTFAMILTLAVADDPSKDTAKWVKAARVLPAVQLKGSTEPKGELKVGVVFAHAKETTTALTTVFLSTALSSGSVNLVEVSRKKVEIADVSLGVQAAFLLGATSDVDDAKTFTWKLTSFEQCIEICKDRKADKKCSDLLKIATEAADATKKTEKLELEIVEIEKLIAATSDNEELLRAELDAELDRLRRRELEARRALLTAREAPAFARRESEALARVVDAEHAVERAALDVARAQLLEFDATEAQKAATELRALLATLSSSRTALVGSRAESEKIKTTQALKPRMSQLHTGKLCEAGLATYKEAENREALVTANLAPNFLSFGAQVGARNQKFVQGTGVVDGVDSPPFAEVKRASFTSKAAFSYARILPQVKAKHTTAYFELMAGHSYGRTPSELLVKWCEGVGNGRPKIVGSDATGPGQICGEAPWGRPRPAHRLALGLWAGALESNSGWWRIGAGLRYDVVLQPTELASALSFEVPVYFNLPRADPKNDLKNIEYKGLFRVAPRLTSQFDPKLGWQFALILSVDLLAQRSIFLHSLDWM